LHRAVRRLRIAGLDGSQDGAGRAQNAAALKTALSSLNEQELASWDGLASLIQQARQTEALAGDLRNLTGGVAGRRM
jgi:hypothetical protein